MTEQASAVAEADMLLKKILRLFRKRIVLAVIFSFSFTYFIVSIVRGNGDMYLGELDVQPVPLPAEHFQWHTVEDKGNRTNSKISTCRNSVQGKVLIADDRGYVCQRHDILSDGCCNTKSASSKQYSCDTCQENGCCSIYEYCISCCLQPEKKVLLQKILGKNSEAFNILFASITDHFELCLAKCRTSSQSVQHENSYRDPKAKHCYGESPPPVQVPSGS